jgi:hypothetical protein
MSLEHALEAMAGEQYFPAIHESIASDLLQGEPESSVPAWRRTWPRPASGWRRGADRVRRSVPMRELCGRVNATKRNYPLFDGQRTRRL